jgi:four helix bundle protein
MGVQSFKDLEVWQVAMDVAVQCYESTRVFPREELFGMTGQIRRASASVPANIAEGQGRDHTKEFVHFLSVAKGSLAELETHLLLSHRVGLMKQHQLDAILLLVERVGKMLTALRKALQRRL